MFKKKICLVLLAVFIFFLTLPLTSFIAISYEDDVSDLSIHVLESNSIRKYDKPVWVRGIWHYVNFTLNNEINKIKLVFYHDDEPVEQGSRNETNYYHWEYDSGDWDDIQHNSKYLEVDYCEYYSNFYSFYIGIDQYAKIGNWTLEIWQDDETLLSSEQIYVDKAVTSLTVKTIPVVLKTLPFTEQNIVSEDKFTVENDGNVPVKLSVDYGDYDDIFSTLDFDEILVPGQKAKYYVMVHSSSSWQPGSLNIGSNEASVNGEALYVIPPKTSVSLIQSNLSFGLPMVIYIGHSGYEFEPLTDDISFQYDKNLNIYCDETREVIAYISGDGEVNINIDSQNLEILNIFSGNVEVDSFFTVKSTRDKESSIRVMVRGLIPNSTAYLTYDLEIDGEHQLFTTTINVGALQYGKTVDTTVVVVVVIVCIIIILYMLYIYFRYRRK